MELRICFRTGSTGGAQLNIMVKYVNRSRLLLAIFSNMLYFNKHIKGGFPLSEIFRPNRNFLLSYKHSDGTKQKSFEFEQ
jgi:hypothetical protein